MFVEDGNTVSRLIGQFGGQWCAPEHHATDGTLGYGTIHHTLIRILRPQHVLCIGSRRGFIPACIAAALKANGKGHLTFVDANYSDQKDGRSRAWGGDGKWESRDFGELADVITLRLMRSDEFFKGNQERFGYIYLDGAHDFDTVMQDFVDATHHLADGGLITMHDALLKHPYGVRKVLAELDPLEWTSIVIPPRPGLAIVQRARDAR